MFSVNKLDCKHTVNISNSAYLFLKPVLSAFPEITPESMLHSDSDAVFRAVNNTYGRRIHTQRERSFHISN